MIKISIYDTKQFKKHGSLKKNAKAEYVHEAETIDKFKEAEHLKAVGYHNFKTPYIFTHIQALNAKNEPVLIFQDVNIGGKWLITSPQELLTNLI